LRPLAHGEQVPGSGIAEVGKAAGRAYQARLIDPDTLAWQWPAPRNLVEALSPILLDATELLTAGDHARLRFCPSCDWLFEDQTRNGQRRWCDMADCGSRDKSRRYYQRSKS
jgi:predicted RNA-binding Zn ribbon-like protein